MDKYVKAFEGVVTWFRHLLMGAIVLAVSLNSTFDWVPTDKMNSVLVVLAGLGFYSAPAKKDGGKKK